MLFEWIIYKALKDRQISRLHRFQVLFHSGITPVSRISSRNWYYITHQGKCYFSNYLAKYFFSPRRDHAWGSGSAKYRICSDQQIVWVACAYSNSVSVSFLVANIVIRRGERTAGPVPFFFPLPLSSEGFYTVGDSSRGLRMNAVQKVCLVLSSLIKTTRAHFQNEKRLLDRIRLWYWGQPKGKQMKKAL